MFKPPSGDMNRRDLLLTLGAAVGVGLGSTARVTSQEAPAPRGLDAIADALPRTTAVIRTTAAQGGAGQFYLSRDGKVLADVAWGAARGGAAYTPATLVSWASAVKPTTCVCLMKLWERGRLDVDDRVTKYIPEFGANGKGDVRIRHLLTHTAHLGGYGGPQDLPARFEDSINAIARAPRQPYPAGGSRTLPPLGSGSGYNPAGIWIIAEICRRLYDQPPQDVLRKEVYEPCGMRDSWCGMPLARYRAYKAEGRFASNYLDSEEQVVKCQPAGGGIGPTRELARFYEMMINRGTIGGRRILTPQTVEAMTTPKSDLGYMGLWGFGFNVAIPGGVDAPKVGRRGQTLQNRYGTHSSGRTFGHAGASGMQAFGDPEYGIATAFIGRAPIADTIYEDLGLAGQRI